MRAVTEAEVVWQYIRWHAEYREHSALRIITDPDLNNPDENSARWDLLARNKGHVLRVRYPFLDPPQPYEWTARPIPDGGFAGVSSNYTIGSGSDERFLGIEEIAQRYVRDGRLPGFDDGFCRVIEENTRRLRADEEAPPDFNAIILCRPHPRLPAEKYRVVEGSKRAIAVRVEELRGARVPLLPLLHAYLGAYLGPQPRPT